jgi:hypothetical protein
MSWKIENYFPKETENLVANELEKPKISPKTMARVWKNLSQNKRLVKTKSRSLSPNLTLPRSNIGS